VHVRQQTALLQRGVTFGGADADIHFRREIKIKSIMDFVYENGINDDVCGTVGQRLMN
jgi:hypothetical protein